MNIEELKRLAFDSKAWYDAGAVINDPYDTHPNELFDAAVDETVVLDLISQIEQLRAGVNTCGAGAGCCAQAAEIERLKAELGDLPEAQADPLRNEVEAAETLGVKPATLQIWRCTKRYALPYIKVGRLVRYRQSALDAFLTSRTQGAA